MDALQGLTGVATGFAAAELSPDQNRLYATAAELSTLYGVTVDDGQIRFAMDLLHMTCCRPTLWPTTYTERLPVPSDRNQVILSARPVLQLTAAAGRYSYGRRDRLSLNSIQHDHLAALALQGSPPAWTTIDVEQIDVHGATGQCWLPTGLFSVGYSEVQLQYVTGLTDIPSRVKAALIEIINTVQTKQQSDRTQFYMGKVQQSFSKPGFVTDTAAQLLDPYIVRSFG